MGSNSFNTVTVAHQVDNVLMSNSDHLIVDKGDFNSGITDTVANALSADKIRVFPRMFYNSAVNKRNVQALLAKSTKNKYMRGRVSSLNQNNKCIQQCVTTVSTQGKCDTPLSDTCVDFVKGKNSQYTNNVSGNVKDGQCQGVRNIMASGHQKFAPLTDNNTGVNKARPEAIQSGGLFSSPTTGNNQFEGVKESLTSGHHEVTPLTKHNTCINKFRPVTMQSGGLFSSPTAKNNQVECVNESLTSCQYEVTSLASKNTCINESRPVTMQSGGLFSSPNVKNNQIESVKENLTSGQSKVTTSKVDNPITEVSLNNTMGEQRSRVTPRCCNSKHFPPKSKVTQECGTGQSVNVTPLCTKNNESVGRDHSRALLYDINGFDDDKFANIVGNMFGKQQAFKTDHDYGPYFSLWRQQSRFDFGFIPLSTFIFPRHSKQAEPIYCPIKIHNLVKQSGVYNFLGCRIPVQTQLNVEEWSRQLKGYWDTQLIDLITYGFPLDFNRNSPLRWEERNHKSALDFPRDVETYLQEEIQHGAIMGPYSAHPIDKSHFSPFMTREKSNATNRRVIIDLSWPKDASVNLGVDKNSYLATDFLLNLPTVDHITNELKSMGRGAHLFKVDVSRAFRHVKLDPSDYDVLGLKWNDLTYFDTCLPFGSRHGTQIFQRLSDAIRHMMRRLGYDVINYVDDFVGVATPSVARRSYDALIELLEKLGLEVSSKKLVPPSTKATCLGIEIDSESCTVAIPPDKLRQISDMVEEWRQAKFCSRRQLQSLLGNLLYVQKCVKHSRIFLNRMLELLRQNYDKNSITLTQDFKRDLRWFHKFLTTYNGVSYFQHARADEILELDACLAGLGGRWGSKVYHLPVGNQYKNLAITQLEMVNILLAVKLFAREWQYKKIYVKCDNLAVVQVLSSGRTKDPFLGACARNIWLIAATNDIDLGYVHIPGKKNCVADLLSRWQYTYANHIQLQKYIENPVWCRVSQQLLDMDPEI